MDASGPIPVDGVTTPVLPTDVVVGDFAGMNAVYAGFFHDPMPARSTIGADLAIEAAALVGAGG